MTYPTELKRRLDWPSWPPRETPGPRSHKKVFPKICRESLSSEVGEVVEIEGLFELILGVDAVDLELVTIAEIELGELLLLVVFGFLSRLFEFGRSAIVEDNPVLLLLEVEDCVFAHALTIVELIVPFEAPHLVVAVPTTEHIVEI